VVVAGGVAALPFITDQYVNLGAACWIAETEEGRPRIPGIIYRFPGHYCIIWACNIYIFFSYRSVLKYLSLLRVEKRKARESRSSFQLSEENMQIKKTVHLLMYYPCKQVFIYCLRSSLCISSKLPSFMLTCSDCIRSVGPAHRSAAVPGHKEQPGCADRGHRDL
jgi:hypothetical protein